MLRAAIIPKCDRVSPPAEMSAQGSGFKSRDRLRPLHEHGDPSRQFRARAAERQRKRTAVACGRRRSSVRQAAVHYKEAKRPAPLAAAKGGPGVARFLTSHRRRLLLFCRRVRPGLEGNDLLITPAITMNSWATMSEATEQKSNSCREQISANAFANASSSRSCALTSEKARARRVAARRRLRPRSPWRDRMLAPAQP